MSMLKEKFLDFVHTLNITDELKDFAEMLTDKDLLGSGINTDELFGPDGRLAAAKMLYRLYDISKGYTLRDGNVNIVCRHTNYLELPLTRSTKKVLLARGRVELGDLYEIAMHEKLYDAVELINRLDLVSTIRYRDYKEENNDII